jgi:exodeoxyribonuclease VII small subunit
LRRQKVEAKERSKVRAGNAPEPEPGFEESLQRLEAIVKKLEEGDLPLEETLRLFEEGQGLLRRCGELLGKAELRVQELLRRADGVLELRPGAGPQGLESGEGGEGTRGAGTEGAGR